MSFGSCGSEGGCGTCVSQCNVFLNRSVSGSAVSKTRSSSTNTEAGELIVTRVMPPAATLSVPNAGPNVMVSLPRELLPAKASIVTGFPVPEFEPALIST